MLLPILLNALFATTFPLAKMALAYTTPFVLTGVRHILSGIMLLAYVSIFRRSDFYFNIRYWYLLLYFALGNIFLTNALQYWAVSYVAAGKAACINNLAPFFAIIGSYLLFQERITHVRIVGVSIACAAIMPLFLSTSDHSMRHVGYLPECALVLAAILSVWTWLGMKKMMILQASSMVMANGFSMLIGGLCYVPLWYLDDRPVQMHMSAWPYIIALAIINDIIGYTLYGTLLKSYSAPLLFLTGLVAPICAYWYSWLFLAEPFTWHALLALAGVSSGLMLLYYDNKRMGYVT